MVLLPNQIQAIDAANKARDLAIVFAVTSIFSTLTAPLPRRAFRSDAESRWGRRAPWIAIGAVVGALCLFAASQMRQLWSIAFFWVGATVALNSVQAALTSIVADRFRTERGTVSGFVARA